MSFILILAGCNAAEKEKEEYFDSMEKIFDDQKEEIQLKTEEFLDAVSNSESEKSIEILSEEMIPKYEELVETMDEAELKENDLLIELNELSKELVESDMDIFIVLRDLFGEIMEAKESGEEDEVDVEARLEEVHKLSEEQVSKSEEYAKKMKDVLVEYEDADMTEEEALDNIVTMNAEEIYAGYEEIIMQFIDNVGGLSSKTNGAVDIDENIMSDQGNAEVVFEGDVKIDGRFEIQGKSNLPEGSVLSMNSYEYGTENPYFKGDIPVEADGSFTMEADIETETLDGELLVVRIAYMPESTKNEQNVGIHGVEGEKLEGDFVHPYTSIKRTRNGAFAYAYLDLNEGEEAQLEADVWGEEPDDYGDLNVWMEESNVEVTEKYYDITMNSNLKELTHIDGRMKVPGYESTNFRGSTKVLPDGSFRLQVPRLDVESDDISIEITAVSDFSIATEELYGANGENFKGDLVESTERGQKIKYKLPIEQGE